MTRCVPLFGSITCKVAMPPMPHISGSTTPWVRAQASAASSALPPAASRMAPASAASGCGATTMARGAGRRRGGFGMAMVLPSGPELLVPQHLGNALGGDAEQLPALLRAGYPSIAHHAGRRDFLEGAAHQQAGRLAL